MANDDGATTRRFRDHLRRVNARLLNPVTMRFAGRPFVPYGLVRHRGRRSGRAYDTPVLVGMAGESVYVPLPYGADTDWCANVRAAGECTVAVHGAAYRATSPTLVAPGEGAGALPAWAQRLVGAAGTDRYLRLDLSAPDLDRYRAVTRAHPLGPAVAALAVLAALALWLWWGGR